MFILKFFAVMQDSDQGQFEGFLTKSSLEGFLTRDKLEGFLTRDNLKRVT